jgi:predicted RNA-binding protein with PIN domain
VPSVAELPEPVRARVVALTAGVLPLVPELPATLRRIADFAPARRAKAGGTAIAVALDVDPEAEGGLRERVAVQLRSAQPRYAAERLPADADATEVAAFAWLLRPEGWPEQLAAAVERLQVRPAVAEQDLVRLQKRVAQLEEELREARERRRTDLESLKQENALLRRRLGEARASGREVLLGAEEAVAAAEAARAAAEATAESHQREVRQLRSRVTQLEADAGEDRRSARVEREAATQRARLLLDTLAEAASGLRRELGLPHTPGTPGEAVEATYAASQGAERNRAVAGLGELEGYLAMPRARLIVDGYNVTKQAWSTSPLEAQRNRLVQALAPLVARTGAETTVVFDAAAVPGAAARHVVGAPRGVRVVFSPAGVIADDVIRELVAAEPVGRVVLVVTDDQAVARDVAAAGARPVPTTVLLQSLR